MNPTWQNFLNTQPLNATANNNVFYPTTYLSILKISGSDASPFLQGQLTCNINELTENNSFFAGFCNAKGRVISTFLILKQQDAFLLILPRVLLDTVHNKLQRYILRSKVQLKNVSDDYGLIGINCTSEMATTLGLPEAIFSRNHAYLKLSQNHYLVINAVPESIENWTALVKQGFQVQHTDLGQYLDLNAGLAWLDCSTSEEYIPQMLNLDKLGGISFTKGCYTGQEIIARTHYLGQVKRELFLAESTTEIVFTPEMRVINETGQEVGQILSIQNYQNRHKLLLIMLMSAIETTELKLNHSKQAKISLIPFETV